MSKGRMEAFSDGVFAIVITIMVLELKPPHGASATTLRALLPTFLCYVLSFVFLAIYWNNHHHLLQAVRHVDGPVLWANMHLLFWLSLTPCVTAWMGDNSFAPLPVALYGGVLFMSAVAYFVLARALVALHGSGSAIAKALGADAKGRISLVIYAVAIALAFARPLWSCALYVVVAILWLVPDPRIERELRRT
jgi:uncharacterized membrane protein